MNPIEQSLRSLSPGDFASWGVDYLAFVKAVVVDGRGGFAVHAADGTPLAVLADRDTAFAAVRQNDMEPVSVH